MPSFDSDLVVRNGRLIDPAHGVDAIADVHIERGHIAAVGPRLSADPSVPAFDATGLIVAPGFIDVHVHLREPGCEYEETIASGTAAAAAGGICAVAAMPNTQPPPDGEENLRAILQRAASSQVRFYPIACITQGRRGRGRLAPLEELAAMGAVAFSDDGDPVEDEGLMRRALEIARHLDRPIFPHEEVRAMTRGGCMHAGAVAARLGVGGMPAGGEEAMISRDIELVRQTGGPLHIAHISTAGAVELVRRARSEGLPVSCEVLPHHFILTDEEVARLGTAAKMSPPLRTAADVEAVLAALQDGTIEVIATDHAPHSAEEKALPLEQAPFGIVGLETAIGLTLTYLVGRGVLDLSAAIARWTCHPARILRLPGGHLGAGAPGDLTIIDPDMCWKVEPAQFRSRSRNTPFAGWQLKGRAVATVVGGELVYDGRTGMTPMDRLGERSGS